MGAAEKAVEQPTQSAGTDVPALPPASGARLRDAALIAYGRAFEHPSKIRFVRWLVRRLAAGRIKVRHAPGAVIAIDPADYIGWAVFSTGHYEPTTLDLALRIMAAEPGLFVDVGANFGWYTCAVAAITGSTVVSIEPDCENCAFLRANIALNGSRNVIVFSGAVGPSPALLPMSRRAPGNSGTVAVSSGEGVCAPDGHWVAATPLDVLLDRLVRPAARPVLMKIDVEGFEPQALAGLDFNGPFRPKNILLECDRALSIPSWGSRDNVAAYFADRGYELLDVFGRPLANEGPLPEENAWARDHT